MQCFHRFPATWLLGPFTDVAIPLSGMHKNWMNRIGCLPNDSSKSFIEGLGIPDSFEIYFLLALTGSFRDQSDGKYDMLRSITTRFIPFHLRDDSLSGIPDYLLSDKGFVIVFIELEVVFSPHPCNFFSELREVFLGTTVDEIGLIRPNHRIFSQIGFGKFLVLRIFGQKGFFLTASQVRLSVTILAPGTLIEPLGLVEASPLGPEPRYA